MRLLPFFTSDVFLAPMTGVTDVAFRLLCKKYGAGLTMTEMISANALARSNKAALKLIDVVPEEKPRCIQLFGQNTENMIKAAKFLEEKDKCEIIDLNFGCPAADIVKQGAGSALLERPNKIKEIVEAVSSSVNLPITCKFRLGIRTSNINVLKVAKICEEAGASLITIHARTQKQGYTGKADWSWIKKVKETVKIPVCGNGDVSSVEDYLRMKKETGCDYVMIGRGAMGNPFIFRQIKEFREKGEYEIESDKGKLFPEYLELAKRYKIDFNKIRFQAQAFTKGTRGAARRREKLAKAKTIEEIDRMIRE